MKETFEATDTPEYKHLFSISMAMRQALAMMCDSSNQCTCTVCRAAWAWDHEFGSALGQDLVEDPIDRQSRELNEAKGFDTVR